MVGVGGAGRDERRHGPGLVDAFFQDLSVLGLAVRHELLGIDGLVQLPHRRVDAELAEQTFHAEGAGLVGHDGHHVAADDRVAGQARQHAHESHGRGILAFATALE